MTFNWNKFDKSGGKLLNWLKFRLFNEVVGPRVADGAIFLHSSNYRSQGFRQRLCYGKDDSTINTSHCGSFHVIAAWLWIEIQRLARAAAGDRSAAAAKRCRGSNRTVATSRLSLSIHMTIWSLLSRRVSHKLPVSSVPQR